MAAAIRKPKPGYSLAQRNPGIARYWDLTANGNLAPRDVGPDPPTWPGGSVLATPSIDGRS